MPRISDEHLHDACKLCKFKNSLKADYKDKNGKVIYPSGAFPIQCEGIPKDSEAYIKSITEKSGMLLSEDVIKKMSFMKDPVAWAEHYLRTKKQPWKPRGAELENIKKYNLEPEAEEYQWLMASCNAKKRVFRTGRRVGKSQVMTLLMLWYALTNSEYKILVLTPYITQGKLLYENALDFIDTSFGLKNEVVESRKTPNHEIVFSNKSSIRIFTAGDNGAEAIRGQACDLLLIDEADYIDPNAFDTVLAFLQDSKDVNLIMASTPTGKREKFYESCHNPTFKSFHFPSMASPVWNEEMENEFRMSMTEGGYEREVEAEFGSDDQGVFNKKFIDMAKTDYSYSDIEGPQEGWVYTIGVDWNPVVGSEIVVLGAYDYTNPRGALSKRFQIVEAITIPKKDFRELTAVEKVIEMNRKWKPIAIYVDRGAGSTNIELIHSQGAAKIGSVSFADQIDERLLTIAKAIDFGSSILWKDPFNNEESNRPLKPLMVQNLVKRFEQHVIDVSLHDLLLISQLEGYRVKSLSSNGRPTYEASDSNIGDHRLDALILAAWAFTREIGVYSKNINYEQSILYTNKPLYDNKKEESDRGLLNDEEKGKKERLLRVKPSSRSLERGLESISSENQNFPGSALSFSFWGSSAKKAKRRSDW